MADDKETAALRARIRRLLKSPEVLAIQFIIENVCIQRYMYSYIGESIFQDQVHLKVGNNPKYYWKTNTLELEADASDATIVHESTHALINATHVNRIIRLGTHETAAYLAEALWALNSGNDISINIPHMDVQVARLARKVQAYNAQNPFGLYVCAPQDYMYIQLLMQNSANGTDIEHRDLQVGIGDGPR